MRIVIFGWLFRFGNKRTWIDQTVFSVEVITLIDKNGQVCLFLEAKICPNALASMHNFMAKLFDLVDHWKSFVVGQKSQRM